MSVNMYPAMKVGREVIHVDGWNPESTLNIANNNFFSLMDYLEFPRILIDVPGTISTKALARAIKINRHPAYHDKLVKLVAQAEVLKAPLIAFT